MNEHLRELFHLANSATYPEKWDIFYPLKDELLRKYGIPDGWDLQVIKNECWDCNGTGECFFDQSDCYACDGTGIYSQRSVRLDRYRLGDRVYHIPQAAGIEPSGYKNKIEGLVRHEAVSKEIGWTACQSLLAWHKLIQGNPQLPVAAPVDPDGQCRAAVLGTGVLPQKEETTKGKLVAAIAHFIDTRTAANEALIVGDDETVRVTGDRSWRAAEKLANELEAFVDERISNKLQTTELRGEQY
jgi:hypothetical protein